MRRSIICCVGFAVLLVSERLEAAVTPVYEYVHTTVYDAPPDGSTPLYAIDKSQTNPPVGPSLSLLATLPTGWSSTDVSRSTTSFGFTFEQHQPSDYYISGPASSYATSYAEEMFTVTEPMSYAISGTYAMQGGGYIAFESHLWDGYPGNTGSVLLFSQSQVGYWNPNDTLTLGIPRPDLVHNDLEGLLSGPLSPGHDYYWFYQAAIMNYPDQSISTSAVGSASITFGNPVPEPSTLVMFLGLGGMGLIANARRRRRS